MQIEKKSINASKYITESSERVATAEDMITSAIESLSDSIKDHPEHEDVIRECMANLSVILLDLKSM